MNLQQYLGDNSYVAITQKLTESINSCKPETIRGQKLIEDLQISLNESTTPMHEIKAFQNNAASVSTEDSTLADTLALIKKENAAGDFNYLINLAKEEHIINEKNSGNPAPEQILSSIENLFEDPSNVVIEAIRNNLFDEKLNSELYANLRNDLSINPDTGFAKSKNKIVNPRNVLNESLNMITNGELKQFNPIGIKYAEPDRNIFITQFNALTVDSSKPKNEWEIADVKLPPSYQKLALALGGINYDYDNDKFITTNGLWDFDIAIGSNGKLELTYGTNTQELPIEDLSGLFLETIQQLQNGDDVKMKMSEEADRFIALANNYNKLVKLDTVTVVQDDANFIVMNNDIVEPKLISNNVTGEVAFTDFKSMVSTLNESFNSDVAQVFSQQLITENELIEESYAAKQQLNENQQTLNQLIESTQKIIDIAEDDSPAKKLAEAEMVELNESLKLNISDLQEINSKPLYS